MVTIDIFLILAKLKYIKIFFKSPAEYLRPYYHKDHLHSKASGIKGNVLNIFKLLSVHLKHKCVCLQKSKSPWQQKLKSAVLEGFVDTTLIKARRVTLECQVKRHYGHNCQWSTWLCLWASIRGQGDDAPCTGRSAVPLSSAWLWTKISFFPVFPAWACHVVDPWELC